MLGSPKSELKDQSKHSSDDQESDHEETDRGMSDIVCVNV